MSRFIGYFENKCYLSKTNFSQYVYDYIQNIQRNTGHLSSVYIEPHDARENTVIQYTGRKLFPGIHPGISSQMISIRFRSTNNNKIYSGFITHDSLEHISFPENTSTISTHILNFQDIYNFGNSIIETNQEIGCVCLKSSENNTALSIKNNEYINTINFYGNGNIVTTGTSYISTISSQTLVNTEIAHMSTLSCTNGYFMNMNTQSLFVSTNIIASGNIIGANVSGINTGDQTIVLSGNISGIGTGIINATVLTNADLSGAITSVGNTTSLNHYHITSLSTVTTTSETDILMTGMSITPSRGTYLLWFDTCAFNNSKNLSMTFSVYVGGFLLSSSIKQIITTQSLQSISLQSLVSVNGSQSVEIRWKVARSIGSSTQRTLTLIRVS